MAKKGSVPEAKGYLEKLKYETAGELGVNLKQGYNGDLTTKQAGSVGGQMVKKMYPIEQLSFTRVFRSGSRHTRSVKYVVNVGI